MNEKVRAIALLPADAARDLTIQAAQQGISGEDYLGIQALRGAYGALHPDVAAFDQRATLGQVGTQTSESEGA